MSRITASTAIDAPVEAVFQYVDDYRNTTRYMQGLSRWEPVGDRTHGKGAIFEVGMKAGPLTIDGSVQITAWTENRAIAWVGRPGRAGVRQSGRWTFRQLDGGATATLEVTVELPGGLAGRVVARAAEPILRGNLERSVDALKQQVEARSRRPVRSARRSRPPSAS